MELITERIYKRHGKMKKNSFFCFRKNHTFWYQNDSIFLEKFFKKALRFMKKVANWGLLLWAELCSVNNIFFLSQKKQ